MKSLLSNRLTWVKIVESVLLILLGVFVSVIGGVYHDEIQIGVTICIAIFLLIDGVITLLEFWLEPKKNFTFSSVLGALFITTGVLLSISASENKDLGILIANFISILLIVFGGIYIVKAIIQTVYKGPVGWLIIHYLIGAFGIALGVTSIIYSKDKTLEIVLVVLGIAIAVLGAIDLIFAIIKYRKVKLEEKKNKEKEPEKVNVDVELDGDKVVMAGKGKDKKAKKEKKAKKLAQKEVKQIAAEETKQLEDKSSEAKDDDKAEDTPVEAEVIDPEK